MARVKCNSCGGEYATILPDGMRYFHACPPVVDAETGASVERADKRDENVVPSVDGKTPARLKAEGKGAREL